MFRKPTEDELVTADSVAAMLREAGAKEPWPGFDQCAVLAQRLTYFRMIAKTKPPKAVKSIRSPYERGQDAAKEILRVLPHLREEQTFPYKNEFGPPASEVAWIDAERKDRLNKLRRLGKLLVECFDDHALKGTVEGDWSENAAGFHNAYRAIVGAGSLSRNGPAIRFVRLALLKSELGEHTEDAIAKALARRLHEQEKQGQTHH